MRSIITIIFVLLGFYAQAQCTATTQITQSTSQSIIDVNSVSCNTGGLHADNSYMREFDMSAYPDGFTIESVDFGIESAASASGGSQPITVNLYTLSGPLMLANLTLLHSEDIMVADQTETVLNVPMSSSVAVPAGSTLVYEVFTPNGQGVGDSFFIGSNDLGESGPTYITTADCGIPEPLTLAMVGFPDMHAVMNINGCATAATTASDIPTLGEWGIISLLLLLLIVGVASVRYRTVAITKG